MRGHDLIKKERKRQIASSGEHFTAAHDNQHTDRQLLSAAYVYLAHAMYGNENNGADALWPWEPERLKPADVQKNLIRAGALIAAELDRLNRRSGKDPEFS